MDLLKPEHPSYACDQAWFLFGMRKLGATVRLFLVEASGRSQVHLLERLSEGGSVSPTCALMAVFRSCPDVGIRSDAVEEISIEDFVDSLVAPERRVPVPAPEPARAEAVPKKIKRPGSVRTEAMAALVGLGFKKDQAADMISVLGPKVEEMGLEELVKAALRASAPA